MKNLIEALLKIAIAVCFLGGAFLIYQSRETKRQQQMESKNEKAIILKKFLLTYKKPQRIEIFSYTQKFQKDVEEIKQMNAPLDQSSDIYITIQFFTDENDPAAPLVAQVRFMDTKSDNMLKEQSINLQ